MAAVRRLAVRVEGFAGLAALPALQTLLQGSGAATGTGKGAGKGPGKGAARDLEGAAFWAAAEVDDGRRVHRAERELGPVPRDPANAAAMADLARPFAAEFELELSSLLLDAVAHRPLRLALWTQADHATRTPLGAALVSLAPLLDGDVAMRGDFAVASEPEGAALECRARVSVGVSAPLVSEEDAGRGITLRIELQRVAGLPAPWFAHALPAEEPPAGAASKAGAKKPAQPAAASAAAKSRKGAPAQERPPVFVVTLRVPLGGGEDWVGRVAAERVEAAPLPGGGFAGALPLDQSASAFLCASARSAALAAVEAGAPLLVATVQRGTLLETEAAAPAEGATIIQLRDGRRVQLDSAPQGVASCTLASLSRANALAASDSFKVAWSDGAIVPGDSSTLTLSCSLSSPLRAPPLPTPPRLAELFPPRTAPPPPMPSPRTELACLVVNEVAPLVATRLAEARAEASARALDVDALRLAQYHLTASGEHAALKERLKPVLARLAAASGAAQIEPLACRVPAIHAAAWPVVRAALAGEIVVVPRAWSIVSEILAALGLAGDAEAARLRHAEAAARGGDAAAVANAMAAESEALLDWERARRLREDALRFALWQAEAEASGAERAARIASALLAFASSALRLGDDARAECALRESLRIDDSTTAPALLLLLALLLQNARPRAELEPLLSAALADSALRALPALWVLRARADEAIDPRRSARWAAAAQALCADAAAAARATAQSASPLRCAEEAALAGDARTLTALFCEQLGLARLAAELLAAVPSSPAGPAAAALRARVWLAQGRHAEAAAALEAAIAAAPSERMCLELLPLLARAQQHSNAARSAATLQRYFAWQPPRPDRWAAIAHARALREAGKVEAAADVLQEVCAWAPGAAALTALGETLAALPARLSDAEAALLAANALDPRDAHVLALLLLVALRRGAEGGEVAARAAAALRAVGGEALSARDAALLCEAGELFLREGRFVEAEWAAARAAALPAEASALAERVRARQGLAAAR
jgi:hypothetical protein